MKISNKALSYPNFAYLSSLYFRYTDLKDDNNKNYVQKMYVRI